MTTDAQLAVQAFSGTSHVPEDRAKSALDELRSVLASGEEQIRSKAKNDAQKALAEELVEQWKAGYRKRWAAYMGARSRVISPMIAGPANFPVRRNEKANRSADKRCEELCEFRPWFMGKAMRRLADLRTAEEVEAAEVRRLKAIMASELAMVNAIKNGDPRWRGFQVSAFRNSAAGKVSRGDRGAARKALAWLREEQKNHKHELFTARNKVWKILDEPEPEEPAGPTGEREEATGDGWRVVSDFDADRVRIYFDGKPSDDLRASLKGAAWRWSPTAGAWQRKLTSAARQSALAIVGAA